MPANLADRGNVSAAKLRRLHICNFAGNALLSAVLVAVPFAAMTGVSVLSGPAGAQSLPLKPRNPDAQLLLKADELTYDNDAEVVTARGNVQLDFDGYNLVAQRVVYDQKTSRVKAYGNVEILEPDGNKVYAQEIDLTDDFGNGFVNALRVETTDNTRFAAESAQRFDGQKTVFNHGVYTACEPCKDNPSKPPIWQVKAERVILNGVTKTVSYEKATFELFGLPIAYLPYFSHADPSIKRKSGWLVPSVGYEDELGVWYRQSYFLKTGETHDLTLSGTGYSRQGFLAEARWRHQLDSGFYTLRAAGIHQIDPARFDSAPDTTVENRGLVASTGRFNINPRWTFGWDVLAQSDRSFAQTFDIEGYSSDNITNQIFLRGLNDRSYFDLSGYQYLVQGTNFQDQDEQALVHPVLDYNYVTSEGFTGGELALNVNVASLSRTTLSTDNPLAIPPSGDQRTFGIDGEVTRATVDASWKKTWNTAAGLMLTPSLSLRGDVTSANGFADPASEIVDTGTTTRFMPTAAFEVSYPVLARTATSSHVFEPIAQILLRPDLAYTGILPNEDAQSLVFDASNLFSHDKFSGYDRIESGTRANIGLRYNGLFANGWSVSGVIGQSFHLAGDNPYAKADLANTGAESGLETDRSDYVAGLGVSFNNGFSLNTNARFDEQELDIKRTEAKLSYTSNDLTLSTNYTYVTAQPEYGFQNNRQEVGLGTSFSITENWKAFGAVTYNINDDFFVNKSAGLTYHDQCFTFSLAFSETDSRATTQEVNRSVMFKIGIRTIGDIQQEIDVGNLGRL